jgi:hypothetical protein
VAPPVVLPGELVALIRKARLLGLRRVALDRLKRWERAGHALLC